MDPIFSHTNEWTPPPLNIPQHWRQLDFEDAFVSVAVAPLKIPQKKYLSSGIIPIVDQGAELIGGYTNDESKCVKSTRPLIVFGDHTKCFKLVDFPFAPGADGVKVLKPTTIDERFAYYACQALRLPDRGYSRHYSFLKKSKIPLAPRKEQHRIVAKIDELFSKLDKGIESLKTARKQLEVYRQSVLKHAFEGKLTAQWRAENKDKLETPEQLLARIKKERAEHYERQFNEWKTSSARWHRECQQGQKPKKPLKPKPLPPLATKTLTGLPPLPSGWLWARIGEIGLVGTGVTPLKSKSEYYVNGDVPWVTSGALNDPFVSRSTHYVTKAALNDTNLRVYPPNTLVVALYGEGKTRGKCSELLIEATTNQAIAAIVQEGIAEGLRGMLKWFLMKNYEEVRIGSSGGVQPNLNLGIIENSLVPVCSIDEATEIEKNIKQKFSQADELEKELVTRLQQSDVLRQAILKKAFSGQLVPQDSNDEPASVLLDRIKAERKQKSKSKIVTRRTTKKRTIA